MKQNMKKGGKKSHIDGPWSESVLEKLLCQATHTHAHAYVLHFLCNPVARKEYPVWSKLLIFLLIHKCGFCLFGSGEPLLSTFPFNHFSREILTHSSCGICWNLTGFHAWDWRCDFWVFCRNTAGLWRGLLGRYHLQMQEGFLDLQDLTCYWLLHVCYIPQNAVYGVAVLNPHGSWREKARLWTLGKVGW